MKKIIILSGAVLLSVAGLVSAGGFEELLAGAAQGPSAPQSAVIEVKLPEPGKAAFAGPGDGAIRLAVEAGNGIAVSASAIYSARKDSYFCTEYTWNEGSGGRTPKRMYPAFNPKDGVITLPEAVDSSCDYTRVDEGTLSFSIPGKAEPYNSVTVLAGGGSGEQQVSCKLISVQHPSGEKKPMLSCYGLVRLDANNQARVRVTLAGAVAEKSVLAEEASGSAIAAKDASLSSVPMEWTSIPGGRFMMGTDDPNVGLEDAKPVHQVAVKTFYMTRTDVTVGQYAECVAKGRCTEPGKWVNCNWGQPGRQNHPVNCVNWYQAQIYAKFMGARLPSEAEWEYAARSGGRNQRYPWGNRVASAELAVMNTDTTRPVCSKPAGNTAQGLCDMAGNVWQWVQDEHRPSYNGAPTDGSAADGAGYKRVIRGGSFYYPEDVVMWSANRYYNSPDQSSAVIGFRLAR